MSSVIPEKEDEGDLVPTSVRIPKKILERIDKAAEETGNSRNEAILYLFRWALRQHESERRKSNGRGDGGEPKHAAQ